MGSRPTDDQLYGFAGSPSSQCMIFFSVGMTLDADEFGIEILLSSASTSYWSFASSWSIPDIIRDN
jgi:hypothetical protein